MQFLLYVPCIKVGGIYYVYRFSSSFLLTLSTIAIILSMTITFFKSSIFHHQNFTCMLPIIFFSFLKKFDVAEEIFQFRMPYLIDIYELVITILTLIYSLYPSVRILHFSNTLTVAPIFKGICILNYLSTTELKQGKGKIVSKNISQLFVILSTFSQSVQVMVNLSNTNPPKKYVFS